MAGYHRKHAIRLLASVDPQDGDQGGPAACATARARTYGSEVREALIQLWEVSDRVCGSSR